MWAVGGVHDIWGCRVQTCDYVIVGAGSAGSVLANRLTADGKTTVCVLEAGPRDWHPYIHIPAGFIKTYHDARVDGRASHPRPAREDAWRLELHQRTHIQSRSVHGL